MTNELSKLNLELLRILQQAAWLRGGLIVVSIALYLVAFADPSALPLLLGFAIERGLFITLVSWNALRQKWGRWFMPVTLVWLLLAPMLDIIASILSRDELLRMLGLQADILGISSPLIWLVVPTVIATWQYDWRGLRFALIALVVEHVVLGAVLWHDAIFGFSFVINSLGRIVMLGLIGYVVMLLVRAQKREHAALEQANRQLAQRAATAEQLAESRERNRMARELHDILAHSITALSLQVQAASMSMEQDPAEAKTLLRQAQTTARTSANEVRRAIQALRATPLQDLGLAQALRELCRAQSERTSAKFDGVIADVPALDPLTEQAVYRIAHETLANIEHHAAATRVQVGLQVNTGRKLELTIQDNGIGFDRRVIPQGHYGLVGMTERAREVGGELVVHSEMGKGTQVRLGIPL
jgi:signal transduction histidine kinase